MSLFQIMVIACPTSTLRYLLVTLIRYADRGWPCELLLALRVDLSVGNNHKY
jgi:hypothetical protein